MAKLRILDLFSGIGGFSLGLERTGGFETVAFCEIEDFPRRVLAKHWPGVPCYHDVRELTADRLAADGIAVDVICGGFPCQDISYAGLGAGLGGSRSGLFYEVSRLIGELGPSYIILENVAALLSRGLDAVLGTLASVGYDAEWHCIPASAIGAPHRRDRIWIIAYPRSEQHQGDRPPISGAIAKELSRASAQMAYPQSDGQPFGGAWHERRNFAAESVVRFRNELGGNGSGVDTGHLADASILDVEGIIASQPNAEERQGSQQRQTGPCRDGIGWWAVEPDVGRVANGVPKRVDRLKCLGNAVVPQIPELIGRAILASLTPEPGVAGGQ